MTALGGYAATAITALTAQDTQTVQGDPGNPGCFIAQQMQSLWPMTSVPMPSRPGCCIDVRSSRQWLPLDAHLAGVPVVIDPVMVAKGGARLLDDDTTESLKDAAVAARRC